jgi:hypothetical protein
MRSAYTILVGKPEGKRPFRRPRRKWEDYDRIDPKEIGWVGECEMGSFIFSQVRDQ